MFRQFAATAAAAALSFALVPGISTTANAAPPAPETTRAAENYRTNHSPVLPQEEPPVSAIRNRKTDTRSLYQQAGVAPSPRTEAKLASSESTSVSATNTAANTNSAGQVLPPGIKDHVNQFCGGTGTDGARTQVMYVREADQLNRYTEVAPLLRNEMRYIDDVLAVSSMETGGGKRVRWVTSTDCTLSVLHVVLPDGSITGTHAKTEAALDAAGYLKSNRKYIAFADVAAGGLSGAACGQGTLYMDNKPTDNLNDGRYPQMARVDANCWITDQLYNDVPLHEFLHTLGAVQPDAPNGTAGFHCSDGFEVMCYDDGHAVLREVCPASQTFDIDCNNDDYFHTNPPAGSYVATHWNVANSPFLETVNPLPAPPTISVSATTTNPESGDLVHFTAAVPEGSTVTWDTDAEQCEIAGVPTTGTTFSIRCYEQTNPTVTATVSNSEITVRTAAVPITYRPGPVPQLTVTSPSTAAANSPFTLTASVVNGKGNWSYTWKIRTAGCTAPTLTQPTLSATCDRTLVGKFAEFSVAAVRDDGYMQSSTVATQITETGSANVTVTGPTKVLGGTEGTFTSTVTGASSPTYQWASVNNFGVGAADGPTFTVRPPATTNVQTDTVYLTVTSGGKSVTTYSVYGVVGALTVAIKGPDKVVPGTTALYTASANKPATVVWEDNQPACTLAVTSYNDKEATLVCPETHQGLVSIKATATAGSETVSTTRVVNVTAEPDPVPLATTLAFAATATSPSHMAVALNDSRGRDLAGRTVHLQRKVDGGSYTSIRQVMLSSSGAARFDVSVNQAATYRVVFYGEQGFRASVSAEKRVNVVTRLANARVNGGLQGKLSKGAGKGVANVKVFLQKKTGRGWVNVGWYKTNRMGVVKAKMNPATKTAYRWSYRGASTYYASTSKTITLA